MSMRFFGKVTDIKKEQVPKGEFYDEVMLSCVADGCTNNGKDVFVWVRLLDHKILFYVNAYGNPICEHMWKQAKEDIDYEIEKIREDEQLKWCPHCIRRIPRTSTVCPECGADISNSPS